MKTLVIRFSSIGDIVLTTPVLRCLHQQLGAEVHFLTKSVYLPLLTYNPNLAKTHGYDPTQIAELTRTLRAEKYDHVVDLHRNIRSQKIRASLKSPATTYPKANLEKWMLVNLKVDRMPKNHIVDRYFEAVRSLGVTYDGLGLDFFLDSEISQKAHFDGPFVAFAIGAAHATKRLTEEQIRSLCAKISFPIALLGGKEEGPLGTKLEQEFQHVHNFCAQTSLQDSAEILRQSSLVLTHDTGMMHIAAALKKPIVSVWGSTVPEFGMYPFYPDDAEIFSEIVQVNELRCRPCSKIGYQTCPKKHFRCMLNQDLAKIAASCSSFLSSRIVV